MMSSFFDFGFKTKNLVVLFRDEFGASFEFFVKVGNLFIEEFRGFFVFSVFDIRFGFI